MQFPGYEVMAQSLGRPETLAVPAEGPPSLKERARHVRAVGREMIAGVVGRTAGPTRDDAMDRIRELEARVIDLTTRLEILQDEVRRWEQGRPIPSADMT